MRETSLVQAVMRSWVEQAAIGIEMLAVAIIVVTIVAATVAHLWQMPRQLSEATAYRIYRHRIGRALLLGLEILVAADVIRTVALEPTLQNVLILSLLVLIRTFLSWGLVVEMEQRWPWQASQRGDGENL